MAAPDEKLHGKQAAAIAALLAQRTIAEAAHQVGIGERTLLRWLQEDRAFQAAYRTARRHVVQHAVAQVQQATEHGRRDTGGHYAGRHGPGQCAGQCGEGGLGNGPQSVWNWKTWRPVLWPSKAAQE